MKTTTIEFFREIKKSSGRFVSILFIVALGVAFFSGIRASEPDMRVTGDAYFDQANLMDIKGLVCVLLAGCAAWLVSLWTARRTCRAWLLFSGVTLALLCLV